MSKRRGLPERPLMRHDSHFVEQLFRADEIPIGRKVAIHLIEANPDQPRSSMGDLASLRDSIQVHGVLEPLLVRRKEEDRYQLISGERRFRAALEAGLAEVPCIELDRDPAELIEITLIENLQRKDLTPFEEAEGFVLLRDRHGYTHEQIAKAVGKSRVTVTETLGLSGLPETVKDQCRRADIQSKSFLLELSRLESEEDMLEAIHLFVTTGHFDRDALRQARRQTEPLERAGTLKRFPKQYELNYVATGTSPASPLKVSLVVRGGEANKGAILAAVKELLIKIGGGEIDIEHAGKFSRPAGSGQRSRPADAPTGEPSGTPDPASGEPSDSPGTGSAPERDSS